MAWPSSVRVRVPVQNIHSPFSPNLSNLTVFTMGKASIDWSSLTADSVRTPCRWFVLLSTLTTGPRAHSGKEADD